jgi:U4/U6 small nuclear ribonucleoprotein PRP31
MSTLADELLNDFEDSGSEIEEGQNRFLYYERDVANGFKQHPEGLEMDIDEVDDNDEDMENGNELPGNLPNDEDDEEEAKAKVEKMQLRGVEDVRTVAGLMSSLKPILDVGLPPVTIDDMTFPSPLYSQSTKVYISIGLSPDVKRHPENRTLPIFAARKTNNICRIYRG